MVLETLWSCAWQAEYFGKAFLPQSWENTPKIGFLRFKEKFGHWFSLNLFCDENLYYLLCSCTNPISHKACFWDIDQNGLSQSDCSISKPAISPEQIDETASFFAYSYKFTKSKSWSKILR